MSRSLSLRRAVVQAVRFAASAWRRAPVGLALMTAGLLVPALVGRAEIGVGEAVLILTAQVLALLVGWTLMLRAAVRDIEGPFGGLLGDALRVLASNLLSGLFLSLILLIVGLVLLGIAGASGLAPGEDLQMAAAASLSVSGWQGFVILALEIAALLLLLSLWARLLPAGPATVADRRVVSLAMLGRTRGWGLKPAIGALVVLLPTVLATGALFAMEAHGGWIDWVWAGVCGLIQTPLLAGYATALWRDATPEGDRP